MISIVDQLSCAKRELAMRQNVYPKWVRDGRMTQAKADDEIECMQSIVASLEKLKYLEEVSEEMKCRG